MSEDIRDEMKADDVLATSTPLIEGELVSLPPDVPAAAEEGASKNISIEGGLSVFAVDSNEQLRVLLDRIAQAEGFQVINCKNDHSLPTRIRFEKPCLVLIPFSKGDSFTIAAKAARSTNSAMIVTAESPSQKDVLRAYQAGTLDFLVTPTTEICTTEKLLNGLAFAKDVYKNTGVSAPILAQKEQISVAERLVRIKEHVKDVMALPHATARVVSECDNSKVDARGLAAITKLDPALTSALIKRANSASFGGGSVTTVEGAIVRLGNRMVRSIATLLAAFKLTDTKTKSFAFDRFGLWLHCLAVGVIAERLAILAHAPNKPEDYFLAGILHDFGKLFFDDYLHEEYLAINQQTADGGDLNKAEKQVFGLAHDEMGEFMANRWNLPSAISAAIAQHHNEKFSEPAEQIGLSSTIYVANMLAKAMLLGQSNGHSRAFLPHNLWTQYGLQLEENDDFIRTVITEVKEFVALLKIPQGHSPICTIEPRDEAIVRIEDGGKTDYLLDVFLLRHGWKSSRSSGPAAVGTFNYVIYDLRQGRPALTESYDIPVERQIVLSPPGAMIPVYIPSDARVISGHSDYLGLLQALEHDHEATPAT